MALAVALAGGLVMSGAVAYADNEPEAPARENAATEAQEGTGEAPAAEDTQEAPAHEDPAPTNPGTSVPIPGGAGFATNGSAAGVARFAQLPADPAYPVPEAPVNDDLPVEVDTITGYQPQISCDPVDRPGVVAFSLLLTEHYDRPVFTGARSCIDYMSYHHDGRAMDWPLDAYDPHERRIGDAAVAWLTDNDAEMMHRFGIEYIIWNELIFMKADNEWRYYTGSAHTDHVHFSFTWDGAQMRTSWWTGVAVTRPDLGPCESAPFQYAALHTFPRLDPCEATSFAAPQVDLGRVRPGESGGGVALLQDVLGVDPSGVLDTATREALIAWQDAQGLPATGVADALTYAAAQGVELGDVPETARAVAPQEWQVTEFTPYKRTTLTQGDEGEAVSILQKMLDAEVDGSFGPATAAALLEWEESVPVLAQQAQRRGDGPATVTPLTWLYLERAAHPTIALRDIELAAGSVDKAADPDGSVAMRSSVEGEGGSLYAGGAVAMVQELLGVEADGSYGPLTADAVRAVQEDAGLEPTGEVDGPTWVALEAVALDEGRIDGLAVAAEDEGDAEAVAAEAAAAEVKAAAEAEAAAEKERAERKRAEREARERHEAAVADASR